MKAAVLTISDSCVAGTRVDESGPFIAGRLQGAGWAIDEMTIVPDEQMEIAEIIEKWATGRHVDVIITTGGTGFSARDVTPEATLSVIDRRTPGISEAIRLYGLNKGVPTACLSRAEAGLRGTTLIINLPGSLHAVQDGMDVLIPLLPHALEMIAGKGH
ncbi:MAG: MogA/MoaB family molybdenum cofactor biosynthesis protein [Candidatus Cryosericum sp.]|nr:MogA/MoaB family molybdenum cofactor biosynthesis protein [bacterium]